MTRRGIALQAVVDLRSALQELECYRRSFSWEGYRLRMCRDCDAECLAAVHGFLDTIGTAPSDGRPNGRDGGDPPSLPDGSSKNVGRRRSAGRPRTEPEPVEQGV